MMFSLFGCLLVAQAQAAERPLNFANRIEPILTKLSCNSGGCHGKIQGQNGFRLSLLGFDPELDFITIVKEARGRRVFSAAPEQSLLLLKATGQVPHGGGRKMNPDSAEYQMVRRWIAEGMPYGDKSDPIVAKVTVTPSTLTMERCVGASGPQSTLTCNDTTTTSSQPVASVKQCDGSGNGGGGTVSCTVTINNHFTGSPTAACHMRAIRALRLAKGPS